MRSFQNTQGVSVLLYMANFNSAIISAPFSITQSLLSGVRFVVGPANTVVTTKLGLSVGVGSESNIAVTQTIRNRLPYPYGDCTYQQFIDDLPAWSNSNYTKTGYSPATCIDACQQKQASSCAISCLRCGSIQCSLSVLN